MTEVEELIWYVWQARTRGAYTSRIWELIKKLFYKSWDEYKNGDYISALSDLKAAMKLCFTSRAT